MANESTATLSEKESRQIPRIKWSDSNMRSAYANVANVTGGKEEIVLLFGMNQAWRPDAEEIEVDLAERIVMSPYAAKRLSLLLNGTLKQYEELYGKIELGRKAAGE